MSSFQPPEAVAVPRDDELFEALFKQSATGIAIASIDTGRFLRVNDAVCAITGYSSAELLEKSFRDITHPRDLGSTEDSLQRLVSGNEEIDAYEKRYLRKDGSQIWVQLVVTLLRPSSQSPGCFVSFIHDITPIVEAREAMQVSEGRFRRMVERSSDWYWEQDAQFRFIELPGFDKRDFSLQDTVGKTRWELPSLGPLPDRVWEQHRAVLERHEPFSDFVFLRYNNSAELRYLSISGEPVFDKDGKFSGYRGIGKDVTEQARAHKALEESEARYRMLFEVHPHPMWVVEATTLKFLAVNEAAVKHYGYSREEFLSMTADQIRPAEDVSLLLEAFEDQSRSYKHRVWRHRRKNGDLIDVEIASFYLQFDGHPARLGVVTDITERLKAEKRAQQIEEQYRLLVKEQES
jgi:PAS domain S-box-containing protein